ncbi:hypothetical protein ACHAWF_006267 [Thalassiosira exigua]
MGAFMYLHPSIYGDVSLGSASRAKKVAAALGVEAVTLQKWFSLGNKESKGYIEKWLPIVDNITWADVATGLSSTWVEQWKIDPTATAKDQLGRYKEHIKGSKKTWLSRYTPETTTAKRKSVARNDSNTSVLKKNTKRGGGGALAWHANTKNSIGQTVAEDCRSMSVVNVTRIQKRFSNEGVQVTINADQTFIKFYMEEDVVVAKTGTKRVDGKIKADVKKGFTLMVVVNMEASQMEPPFSVFDGTKLCKSKRPESTLPWYRNWRGLGAGRTGFMTFQKKHWFDEDITIMWLEWILDVIHPGKKVGISLDMAPAQRGGRVKEYVDKRTADGRLVLKYIEGGLTSVLQVCDLVANKDIKAIIKRLYLQYRTEFIWTERAKYRMSLESVST